MSFDPYGDCCIHPLSIVSHSFSSASKWQLLRTTHQPTRSPPSLSNLHPLPLFPIFLSCSAFLHLPFHNNKISDRWRWIKSVLFTPLDDDGKGSVGLMLLPFSQRAIRRHFILSTACPGRLCHAEIGPIRGCAGRWRMQRSIQGHFPDSLTLTQLHAIWLLYHPVRRGGIKEATCVFFLAPSLPLV